MHRLNKAGKQFILNLKGEKTNDHTTIDGVASSNAKDREIVIHNYEWRNNITVIYYGNIIYY